MGAIRAVAVEPLRLHADNPHYFQFRGKPTVLITSGEHYGAVLNLDFDFLPYLDELKAHGLNLTRAFSGVYCEAPGSFNIQNNTLAPAPRRLICPWARSDQPGYAGGGNKFDLTRWDPTYFDRLKAFVRAAGKRGVVVELVLFCPFDNLDYSFTSDQADGTAVPHAPGGGGRGLRRQLSVLKSFIESFDFIHMAPDTRAIRGGVPDGATARVLSQPGKQYAIYLRGGSAVTLRLDLPAGRYRADWVNTRSGHVGKTEEFDHPGGEAHLVSPAYEGDAALRVVSSQA
jgi:hypothetical protein